MGNSMVPKKKGGAVSYPLVGNLLYQVTFFSYLMITSLHCASNIIRDSFFLTFGGSLTFFSHLTVLSSYCAVLTLHVTVL